jgi:hypothetical protein
VTRVAENELGPTGGEHIAGALSALTGLQKLDLRSTCYICSCCCDACVLLSLCFFEIGGDFGIFVGLRAWVCSGLFIVTRVADNELGPTGGDHIAGALRALTGLQSLRLGSTWFQPLFFAGLVTFG